MKSEVDQLIKFAKLERMQVWIAHFYMSPLILPFPSFMRASSIRRDVEEVRRREEMVILLRETAESALKAGRVSADSWLLCSAIRFN